VCNPTLSLLLLCHGTDHRSSSNYDDYPPQSYGHLMHGWNHRPLHPPMLPPLACEHSVTNSVPELPISDRLGTPSSKIENDLLSTQQAICDCSPPPMSILHQVPLLHWSRDGAPLSKSLHTAHIPERSCNCPAPADHVRSPSLHVLEIEDLVAKLQGIHKVEEKARLLSLRGEPAGRMLDECQTVSSLSFEYCSALMC
jgi:hypothetical protein